MNPKELVGLAGAYMDVYTSQEELDEGEKPFPYGKVGDKLRSLADQKKAAKTPQETNKIAKRQEKINKEYNVPMEQVDLYDIIISHLLDEGYGETPEAAEKIMVHMSEEWREDIAEKFVSPYDGNPNYKDKWGYSPAMRAFRKSEELQKTEPGSKRQKKQTRRSQQLNRMFQAARRS